MKGKAFEAMKARAEKLKDDLCTSFPFHKICNEVVGLHFDNWCEPCQARAVMKAINNHTETTEQQERKL